MVQYFVYRACGEGMGRGMVEGSWEMTRETRESWYREMSWTPEWTIQISMPTYSRVMIDHTAF